MPVRYDIHQIENGSHYRVIFCTTSQYKKDEIGIILENNSIELYDPSYSKSVSCKKLFDFNFSDIDIIEILEPDLEKMVQVKARRAYEQLKVPCIVEHAGLILEEYVGENYPGGLTQPMWDVLGAEKFVHQFPEGERRARAQAVVGYCDGMRVRTYVGETKGRLTDQPKGGRQYYWDPVFIPDLESGEPGTLTYAEIADTGEDGLTNKVRISQSAKAMMNFMGDLAKTGYSDLFPNL